MIQALHPVAAALPEPFSNETFTTDIFLRYLNSNQNKPNSERNGIAAIVNNIASDTTPEDLKGQGMKATVHKIATLATKILAADFEKEKMTPYEALRTATCIKYLEEIPSSVPCTFVKQSMTFPRSLIYCKEKRQIAVVADAKLAKINEKSTYKRVVSSALLNLDVHSAPAKNAVFAHVEMSTTHLHQVARAHSGLNQQKKITCPTVGICSLEFALDRYETIQEGDVKTTLPVEIFAVFEGYQADLTKIIQDVIAVSNLEKLIIMKDLVHGLIQLHAQNIINGDIKPANALFSTDGTELGTKGALTDFDLAFSFENGGTPSYVFKWGYYGSIEFTDPQHYGREGFTSTSIEAYKELDVWALGCVLFQLWNHLEKVPWASYITDTYFNDFTKKKSHKNTALLTNNQNLVRQSIYQTIEEPLNALLKKKRSERTFSENIHHMLFGLLRYDPKTRISLETCAQELLLLIKEAKPIEIECKNTLKLLVEDYMRSGNAKKKDELDTLLLKFDEEGECEPFTKREANKLIEAATSIANEPIAHPAREFFQHILNIFTLIGSAHFEKNPVASQDAWQLAAFCVMQLKSDPEANVQYFSSLHYGFSHDIQFDPTSSLVTIISNSENACKYITEGTYKSYQSAFSFSLTSQSKQAQHTLFMQNKPLATEAVETVVKEMTLLDKIKKTLPAGSQMPVLDPLSYRQEDPETFVDENNYNYIGAIYKDYQGSLVDVIQGLQQVNDRQKLSCAIQLVSKLCCLHQLKIAHGDVKLGNALFQLHDDATVEAIWTDLGAAYIVTDKHPEVTFVFSWGVYGCTKNTEPHFFASEQVTLTPEEHYRLDAWAFGILLHELFIGPIPWEQKMIACFNWINADQMNNLGYSFQENDFIITTKKEIQEGIQEAIEKPFSELCTKKILSKNESLQKIIFSLLRYHPADRITLSSVEQMLEALL